MDLTDIPLWHNILYTHEQAIDGKINNSKFKAALLGNVTRPLMYWISIMSLKQGF
jgi:hypothetical protein